MVNITMQLEKRLAIDHSLLTINQKNYNMPRFIIHHVTKYTYAEFVRDSANQIMLFPLKDEYQEVQQQKLSITNEPAIEVYKDYYGNEIGSFMNIAPHTELRIDSTISVVTKPRVFPKDADSVEMQWNHLQEIRYMVPFIDFLKQENFERLDEVKKIHLHCSRATFRVKQHYRTLGSQSVCTETSTNSRSGDTVVTEASTGSSKCTVEHADALKELPVFLLYPESEALIAACVAGDVNAARAVISSLSTHSSPHKCNVGECAEVDLEIAATTVTEGFSSALSMDPTKPYNTTREQLTVEMIVNRPDSLERLLTPLHIAADSGDAAMISLLLLEGYADPGKLDARSRPPYFLAKDKEARDAFRRCRGLEGMEEKWNWTAAGVPAAITAEIELAQREKEKEKKKRAKAKKKEQKEKDEREAIMMKEREDLQAQAAAAALQKYREENKKSAGSCANCNISLYGIKALDVFDRRCCSSNCVVSLRRKLAAEAALKRLQP